MANMQSRCFEALATFSTTWSYKSWLSSLAPIPFRLTVFKQTGKCLQCIGLATMICQLDPLQHQSLCSVQNVVFVSLTDFAPPHVSFYPLIDFERKMFYVIRQIYNDVLQSSSADEQAFYSPESRNIRTLYI